MAARRPNPKSLEPHATHVLRVARVPYAQLLAAIELDDTLVAAKGAIISTAIYICLALDAVEFKACAALVLVKMPYMAHVPSSGCY